MNKTLRLIIDAFGVLLSGVSTLLLFIQERYVAGGIVLLVLIIAMVMFIHHFFRKPFRYHSLHHTFDILPPDGLSMIWTLEAHFTPQEPNLTVWYDRFFVGPGKIIPVETNLGHLAPPIDEGGTLIVPTIFPTPLQIGKSVSKRLTVRGVNVFPELDENVSWIPINKYSELSFRLNFPRSIPTISARAMFYGRNSHGEIGTLTRSDDGRILELVIKNPKIGNRYVISWKWKRTKRPKSVSRRTHST